MCVHFHGRVYPICGTWFVCGEAIDRLEPATFGGGARREGRDQHTAAAAPSSSRPAAVLFRPAMSWARAWYLMGLALPGSMSG